MLTIQIPFLTFKNCVKLECTLFSHIIMFHEQNCAEIEPLIDIEILNLTFFEVAHPSQ